MTNIETLSNDLNPPAQHAGSQKSGNGMEPEYITIAEYSRVFGPKRTKIYDLMAKGLLVHSFFAGRRMIQVRSARELAEKNIVRSAPSND